MHDLYTRTPITKVNLEREREMWENKNWKEKRQAEGVGMIHSDSEESHKN